MAKGEDGQDQERPQTRVPHGPGHERGRSVLPVITGHLSLKAKNCTSGSHQSKIGADWLPTGFRLASDSKVDVNGTM